MIIYVEGVDGSGKTTLINNLTDRLEILLKNDNIKIVKDANKLIETRPWKDRVTSGVLRDELTRMSRDNSTIYIIDRGPISDIIYRTFDEHKPLVNLINLVKFSTNINTMVVIHCDSDKSYDAMIKRGDENKVALEKYKELRYLFQQIMPLFNPMVVDMFEEKISYMSIAENILKRLGI